MLEEAATVVKISDGQTWVISESNSACAGCMQKTSCSTAALGQFLKKKPVAVDNELSVEIGDNVLVAIDEAVLLRAAFIMYLLPLSGLLFGAGIADHFITPELAYAELWIALSGLVGLAFVLWLMHKISSLHFFNYYPRPMLIKKC